MMGVGLIAQLRTPLLGGLSTAFLSGGKVESYVRLRTNYVRIRKRFIGVVTKGIR